MRAEWLLLLIPFLFLGGSKIMSSIPRGLRNNNPGNIKINDKNNWVGKIPRAQNTDLTFEQFDTIENGVRAAYVLVRNKIKQGYNTLNKLLPVYAPKSDSNPTQKYINFVSAKTGILPNQTLYDFNIESVISAMFEFENGVKIADNVIKAGVAKV